jgi:hypothetical protein
MTARLEALLLFAAAVFIAGMFWVGFVVTAEWLLP